jgi:hypothetical protein
LKDKKHKRIFVGVVLLCVFAVLIFTIVLNNFQPSADTHVVLDATTNRFNKEIVHNLDLVSKPNKSQCDALPDSIDPADDALMDLAYKCYPEVSVKKTYVKLPPFVMPNLAWKDKTRTINGRLVTYKFGEGNPREVALDINDYNGRNGVYINYVTPEVERNLQVFLSNPELKQMIDRCGSILGRDKIDPEIPLIQNPSAVLNSQILSLESMLQINIETGRKEINYDAMIALNAAFNKLNSLNKNNQCSGNGFKNIYAQFGRFTSSYINNPPLYLPDDVNNLEYGFIQKYKKHN